MEHERILAEVSLEVENPILAMARSLRILVHKHASEMGAT